MWEVFIHCIHSVIHSTESTILYNLFKHMKKTLQFRVTLLPTPIDVPSKVRNNCIVILIHFLHLSSEGGANGGNEFCCEDSEFRYSEKNAGLQ